MLLIWAKIVRLIPSFFYPYPLPSPNFSYKPQSFPPYMTEAISWAHCQTVLLWFDATAKC